MNLFEKAKILNESGMYDSCGPKACDVKIREGLGGVYHARSEHRDCKLFKTLMDNSCSFDCKYCSNAKGCSKKKASYTPQEVGTLFNYLVKSYGVHGLFLSSGVGKDPDTTTEKMIEAVKIIRFKHRFRGYIHFKVLPGTSQHLIKYASGFSNRMSINIEAPNKSIMSELSSCKDYKIDILRRQSWISKLNLNNGQSTQIIVNNISSDKEIIKMMKWEYDAFNLRRIYFSAFRPVPGTPMQNEKACADWRQNHLYNTEFLMRQYNYTPKDFSLIMENGMLPYEDPKMAIAKATFDSPLDINEASFEELIRVPGIGPRTAEKIIERTKTQGKKITKYEQLHQMGGWIKRAKPFIEVDGKRQKMLCEF